MRIGFDYDGVLCLTPFGRMAVHAPGDVPPLPAGYERFYERTRPHSPLRLAVEYLRFAWRPMAPDATALLRELNAAGHEVYIVTGRSMAGEPLIRQWLRRNALDGCVSGVRMAPRGLRPSQHKLAVALIERLDAHIDDDPRTAYHLARNGVPRVFLYDHAGAHGGATPPPNLMLVRRLSELPRILAPRASVSGGSP
jgi:phosphoglycolate phosphatase-like HAD superfamily hydrolase